MQHKVTPDRGLGPTRIRQQISCYKRECFCWLGTPYFEHRTHIRFPRKGTHRGSHAVACRKPGARYNGSPQSRSPPLQARLRHAYEPPGVLVNEPLTMLRHGSASSNKRTNSSHVVPSIRWRQAGQSCPRPCKRAVNSSKNASRRASSHCSGWRA